MNIKKMILNMVGLISLVLGGIGVFLPILPTTPFVLLAAACFSIGSPRLSSWLEKNKYLGSYIDNYRHKTGVPLKVKRNAIIYLWIGLMISMLLIRIMIVNMVLVLIGSGVTWHICSLKTRK